MRIEGRTFIVTGGGNGIGREVVLGLLARGASVAAVDLREEGLAETTRLAGTAAASRLTTYAVNVTDRARVAEVIDEVAASGLDGLLNRRRSRTELAGDGTKIDAATGADELPALRQARQRLIHGRPVSEVKQALGGHGGAFGQARRMRQNPFGQPCHRLSPVRNI